MRLLKIMVAALAFPAFALADAAEFQIGTYCLKPNARTEQHIKDIRDCHVDFVYGIDYKDRKTLDMFAKYGLKAVVEGVFPNWWGGNKNINGKMSKIIAPQVVENGVAAMKAAGADVHPAVSMVAIGDEPSALDFPYCNDFVARLRSLLPRQTPFINLHPCYPPVEADFGYVGATNYYAYIDKYIGNVPLDYLSYDHYLYSSLPRQESMGPFLRNFKIAADACRRTGRRFWFVPQVNTRDSKVEMTEQKLRYQANVAMAFGAETLIWACWTEGWWQMNVLDTNGVKTVQYDRLKRVNADIKSIAPRFMEFRNVDTRLVGFERHPDWLKGSDSTSVAALDGGFFRQLKADDGNALVVGIMADRRGVSSRKALYVVAAEDAWDESPKRRTVSFECVGNVSAFDASGSVPLKRTADGRYAFDIKSNGAVLVVMSATPIRLGSWNIRLATMDKWEKNPRFPKWEARMPHVTGLIEEKGFDLMGLQEVCTPQAEFIRKEFPGWGLVGVATNDAERSRTSHANGIFFRRDRFKVLDWGWFGLSETPDVPGVKDWGTMCVRACTWALMEDVKDSCQFMFFNTHFDHRSQLARENGMKLILAEIRARNARKLPVILTGDFNSTAESPQIHLAKKTLVRAYEMSETPPQGPFRTDNCWKFVPPDKEDEKAGKRIDHIFLTPGTRVISHETFGDFYGDNFYPSDHFPLKALIEFPPQ